MSLPPEDPFGLVGLVIDGNYRVDAVVGEGGYGVVYKGWHVAFEQPVAIKALKMVDVTDAETRISVLTKFREEAKLSYVLSQSSLSIARCIGYGAIVTPSQAWAPYLVLEWLDGRPLSEDLEERRKRRLGGRSLGDALELLAPVASALAYAHSQRVAHRDVKPANVFLLSDAPGRPPDAMGGRVKLLDFGIAKVMEAGTTAANAPRTQGGVVAFTPYYASPEQLDPRLGPTGPWTDVYSFALILVEMLSGTAPMRGQDVITILALATDSSRRPTPRSVGVDVPDAVEAAFAQALAVDPKARFVDMHAFWEALTASARVSGSHPPRQSAGIPPGWVSPPRTIPLAIGSALAGRTDDVPATIPFAGQPPQDQAWTPGGGQAPGHPNAAMRPGQVGPSWSGQPSPGVLQSSVLQSSVPTVPPRRSRWKLFAIIACLLLASMAIGAFVASECVK